MTSTETVSGKQKSNINIILKKCNINASVNPSVSGNENSCIIWNDLTGNLHDFNFNVIRGVQDHIFQWLQDTIRETDCYNLFMVDSSVHNIVQVIVMQNHV